MKFNIVAPGIELVGATIKNLTVKNDIVDIEKDAKRSFGLTINEPYFETDDNGIFSIMNIDFEIEVGERGKAFGSIGTKEISEKLEGMGFSVDKKDIVVSGPIKREGVYDVDLKLYKGVSAKIKVSVKAK